MLHALGFGVGIYPLFQKSHQHIFVMAAIENGDFAVFRHHLMHAPQIVSRQFRFARCFECLHANTQWVYVLKHMAYGAVFARSVHALQNHQQLALAFAIQSVLQHIQLG